MTEEEILKPTDYSRSPIRARKSPIRYVFHKNDENDININLRSISEASAFVASLSQENPPKIPPRPHERPNKNTSNHNVSFEIHVSYIFLPFTLFPSITDFILSRNQSR